MSARARNNGVLGSEDLDASSEGDATIFLCGFCHKNVYGTIQDKNRKHMKRAKN